MPLRHRLSGMDLRQLRTFITVAEQGTVSGAAVRLHIAQPALSRQIGALEDALGVKLFDRVRSRLVLTGEGEQLLNDCRTVLGAVDALTEHAGRLRRGAGGVLRVAATPQTTEGVFSTFLHHYAKARPDVQIKLSEAVGAGGPALLERGDIHLVITLLNSVPNETGIFAAHALTPIEFLAAGTAACGPGKSGSIDIAKLAPLPLLLLDSSFFVRTTFDAACRLAGVKPNIRIESRTPHSLLALAEAGHGVAVVPSVLPTHRYRLDIARITHRRRPLREPLAAVWDRRRPLPPYAADFCQALAAYMREIFPISQPKRSAGSRGVRSRPRTP
jgi:DNA-binding transcriptional LysR family regulator